MDLKDELRELLHKVCVVLSSHPDELSVKDVAALIQAYATLMEARAALGETQTVRVVFDQKEIEEWSK